MTALAVTTPPDQRIRRRRNVGLDLEVRWPRPTEQLAWELRRKLDTTHLRLDELAPIDGTTHRCRLRLADPEAHMTPLAALEALDAFGELEWRSAVVLEEIDGLPAYGGLR